MGDGTATEQRWAALLAEHSAAHRRTLFRLAFGVLRDAEAAEDACQAAFLKAWQQRDGIRNPDRLGGWLARTVVNESFRVRRRRKTEQKAHNDQARWRRESDRPAERVANRELALAALEQLPRQTRTIVVMRLMHGASGNEVARQLGCSPAEVSRRLHNGMEQLRGFLRNDRQNAGADDHVTR